MAVSSIAELRYVLSPGRPADGPIECAVAGFATPGDGGAGLWIWCPLNNDLEDGGTCVTSAGGQNGRWKRIFHGAYSVTWFGADGRGHQDASAAFQRAIDAAQSAMGDGAAIEVPPGRYRIEGGFTVLRDNLVLYGAGRSSVLYHPGGLNLANHPPYEQMAGIYASKIEVYGLRFVGDNGDSNGLGFVHATGSQEDMLSCAIALGGGTRFVPNQDISIHHCWFENLFGFGIQCGNGTPSAHLSRVNLSDITTLWCGNGGINVSADYCTMSRVKLFNSEGIETMGFRTTIHDFQIWGAFNGGLTVYGDYAQISSGLVDMTDVVTGSTGLNNAPSAYIFPGMCNSAVVGCVAVNPAGHGFQFLPDTTPGVNRFPTNNTMTGCHVSSTRTVDANHSASNQMVYINSSTGISLVGCHLSGSIGPGYSTAIGLGVFNSSVHVVGGSIANCLNAGADFEAASHDCLLDGTILSRCGNIGVAIQSGCSRITVSNVRARDCAKVDFRVSPGALLARLLFNEGTTRSVDSAATQQETGNTWQ